MNESSWKKTRISFVLVFYTPKMSKIDNNYNHFQGKKCHDLDVSLEIGNKFIMEL